MKYMMKHEIEELFAKYAIKTISDDSRKIAADSAFFAIRGGQNDGNDYIKEALIKGAKLIFTDNLELTENIEPELAKKIKYVKNARLALALAASIIYPKLPPYLVAVTGTNGKSSVGFYVYQLLNLLGKRAAMLGTTGIIISPKLADLAKEYEQDPISLTTLPPIYFRQTLDHLAENNIDYVIFEASSHGLEQKRLGDIKVDTASFVSFSQDHLEYHGSMQAYLGAKLCLFKEHLKENSQVVISAEMGYFAQIQAFLQERQIEHKIVGLAASLEEKQKDERNIDLKISKNQYNGAEQEIEFSYLDQQYRFSTKIIGSFQAINLLIAAELVKQLGFAFKEIVKLLPQLQPVMGRLQQITSQKAEYKIFVDFAHTPDALQKSLQELRSIKKAKGKLYVIFGCGGNRDQVKRPIMGALAARLADQVIITDDNPRFEEPAIIRQQIMQNSQANMTEIAGREEAIKQIIAKLKKDDILLIAGKGHETYQLIKDKKINFSDIEIAKKYIKNN